MPHGFQKSLQFKLEGFLPIPAYQLGNDFHVTCRANDAPADSGGLLEEIDEFIHNNNERADELYAAWLREQDALG